MNFFKNQIRTEVLLTINVHTFGSGIEDEFRICRRTKL